MQINANLRILNANQKQATATMAITTTTGTATTITEQPKIIINNHKKKNSK